VVCCGLLVGKTRKPVDGGL